MARRGGASQTKTTPWVWAERTTTFLRPTEVVPHRMAVCRCWGGRGVGLCFEDIVVGADGGCVVAQRAQHDAVVEARPYEELEPSRAAQEGGGIRRDCSRSHSQPASHLSVFGTRRCELATTLVPSAGHEEPCQAHEVDSWGCGGHQRREQQN